MKLTKKIEKIKKILKDNSFYVLQISIPDQDEDMVNIECEDISHVKFVASLLENPFESYICEAIFEDYFDCFKITYFLEEVDISISTVVDLSFITGIFMNLVRE